MPKLPIVSGATAIRAFQKLGYSVTRIRGSHFRMHHPKRQPISIPKHGTLGRGLLKKLLRESEITIDEFKRVLK